MNPQDPTQHILPEDEVVSMLPASAQKVWAVLKPDQWTTGKELREATGLPRRTIYQASKRLKELKLVEERLSLKDSRQSNFRRKTEKAEAEPENPAEQKVGATVTQAVSREKRIIPFFERKPVEPAETFESTEDEPEDESEPDMKGREAEIWRAILGAGKAVDEAYLQRQTGLYMKAIKLALENLVKHDLIERSLSLEDGTTTIWRRKFQR